MFLSYIYGGIAVQVVKRHLMISNKKNMNMIHKALHIFKVLPLSIFCLQKYCDSYVSWLSLTLNLFCICFC